MSQPRIMVGGVATQALHGELARRVGGEVRFDAGSRAMYACDASHYRQVPIGVVVPRDGDDVVAALAVCRQHGAPVLMRGGGTSLAGQCCNVAVVIDTSRHLNRIVELDPDRRRARVQPGVILDTLRDAAERHGLTFGPDPSTHACCTMGGMIGNNACGVHSVMAGKTVDNVDELDIVTYDGQRMHVGRTDEAQLQQIIDAGGRRGDIYAGLRALRDEFAGLIRQRYPKIPRRVSGYNLDQLLAENGFHVARALVGTEGTCAIVLEATVTLVPSPAARTLVVLGYGNVAAAADDVMAVMSFAPIGLEGTADSLTDNMKAKGVEPAGLKLLPPGRGWLLVEFGGDNRTQANARAKAMMAALGRKPGAPAMALVDNPAEARHVWAAREAAVGASARLADGRDTWPGWEDAAVPPQQLGDYLRQFEQLTTRYGYRSTLYGHFGQGCVHARIDFDMATRHGVARYRAFVHEAADLVVRFGGSLSGEHGDGHSRAELLPKMFGPQLVEAFARFKAIWDPQGKLNPGKVVAPYRLDEHLRLGAGYKLPQLATRFAYPRDEGSFARATARCIGVGKCRREQGGTMCPSYMVTGEEAHSTRGRARLLHELTEGALPDGWRNQDVKAALDLCLACKGCKHDCPAGVDVATYKAEFLHHYYKSRLRPRGAYAIGLIHRWARLASWAPGLANWLTHAPGVGAAAKALAGVAPQRDVPRLAKQTFKQWFVSRPALDSATKAAVNAAAGRRRVLLWADTFTNCFEPQIARAAVRVLEAASFTVVVLRQNLCCGRPLYDYGMLDRAAGMLRHVLTTLGDDPVGRDRDVPIVVLEPSCAAVFRDELLELMPQNAAARQLSERMHTLAECLARHAPDYRPPALDRRAIFHGHCHHKAVMGVEADVALLRSMGVQVESPDTGCCGLAGGFGFERGHYDLSMQVGQRVLLPAVHDAAEATLIVTDGFSCRQQIVHATGRGALHLAQVLAMAHDDTEHRNPHGATP